MDTKTLGKTFTDAVARLKTVKYTGKYTVELNFNQGGNDGKFRETMYRIITVTDINKS